MMEVFGVPNNADLHNIQRLVFRRQGAIMSCCGKWPGWLPEAAIAPSFERFTYLLKCLQHGGTFWLDAG